MRRLHPFLLSFGVLAVAACTPSDEDKDRGDTSPGFGYELARVTGDQDATAAESQAARVIDVSAQELREKLDNGNIRLIDVRTHEEVAQGIIPGAEHIALDEFDPAKLDFSDGREVVLYCRSGRRSGIAGEKLAAHTGASAQHLAGGILGWTAQGFAVETKE